jgi:beta-glucosidase
VRFPEGFVWGAATAAYQIEGGAREGGRGESIWDRFCTLPGKVRNGDDGLVACDFYHRSDEDLALMLELGLDAFRLSIAWPRVLPDGRGRANAAGLDFYDRLIDGLLASGIQPFVTLYHWDLPQVLEDAGGWPERDTAYRFADYAMIVFNALQDRVETWTTMNEPWCSAMLGYAFGDQAPGRRDFAAGIRASHHLMLGHGLATQRMRAAMTSPKQFCITLNLGTATPATDSEADHEAARRADALGARMYLDPLVRGRYPDDLVADLARRNVTIPIEDGDLEIVSVPFDVLGVNYYTGTLFSGVDEDGNRTTAEGYPVVRVVARPDVALTGTGWEIVPEEFTRLLVRLARDYGLPMVVTENGAAFVDEPDERGFVEDADRTEYLASHIRAVADAVELGADVRGYFAWSLLDNFEWAYGYDQRFGIVRVDYETQERIVKQSGLWFRDTIAHHRA